MSTTVHYNVLVIGSGEAGKYLAWTLSKAGNDVVLLLAGLCDPSMIRPCTLVKWPRCHPGYGGLSNAFVLA